MMPGTMAPSCSPEESHFFYSSVSPQSNTGLLAELHPSMVSFFSTKAVRMTILWFLVFPVERKQRRPSYGRVVQLGLQLQKHHSSSPCQWPALPWCPSLSYPGQASLQLEEKSYCCGRKDMWQVLAGVPEGSLSPVSSVKGWEVCHQHDIARHLYFYWMPSQTIESNLAFFFFLLSFSSFSFLLSSFFLQDCTWTA